MKLLVTGASGFIGKNLLQAIPADWQVVAQYNTDHSFPAFVARLQRENVVPVRCDLTNAFEGAALARDHGAEWDACVYLAARVDIPWSVREPRLDLLQNTVSLMNLLEEVRVGKFIYFSSGAVYDGTVGEASPDTPVAPTLPYAISKLACERYVEFYRHRRQTIQACLLVRFFGAYGPYEAPHKIYTRLIQAFGIEGKDHYTIYGDGSNLIDAMYVDDTVDAVMRMLKGDHWDLTVNLAGGHPRRVDELVQDVAVALGAGPVRITRQDVANERNMFWGSVGEMEQLFGFTPKVGLQEGIQRFRDFIVG